MMEGPVHYIVLMLISGVVMGIVFDLYNTVTKAKWLRFLRSFLDVVFFAVSAFFVFQVSLLTDNGRIRFYTFGILLLGYVFYRYTFHNVVVASADTLVRLVQSVFLFLWKLVFFLAVRPILLLFKVCKGLLLGIYKVGCNVEDLFCVCIRYASRVFLFPLKGYLKIFADLQIKLHPYQEGIWNRLSNWLKRPPKGA